MLAFVYSWSGYIWSAKYLPPKVRGECGVLAHIEDIRCFNWWWNSGSAFWRSHCGIMAVRFSIL